MRRPRLTQPGRLYQPARHRPVEACGECGQTWPCAGERARVVGEDAIAKAMEEATAGQRHLALIAEVERRAQAAWAQERINSRKGGNDE